MTPQILIMFTVTGCVACALAAVYFVWYDRSHTSADDRLTTVVNREFKKDRVKKEGGHGLLGMVIPRLSEGLKPKQGIDQDKLKLKLARAGFNGNHPVELFLGAKMICLVAGGFLGCSVAGAVVGMGQSFLFWAGMNPNTASPMLRPTLVE